jgi:hypothetical protein
VSHLKDGGTTACPVCGTAAPGDVSAAGFTTFQCGRCGPWLLEGETIQVGVSVLGHKLGNWDGPSIRRRSRLSHLIRRQQPRDGGVVWLPLHKLDSWRLDDPLPSASRQLEELILLVGDNQPSFAEGAGFSPDLTSAWIGSAITRGSPNAELGWLLDQSETTSVIQLYGTQLQLTMAGWDRYQALKRAEVVSRAAFLAMQFGDEELNYVVDHCFKPAVDRAGFELRVLIDKQPAGSIDDQLRVALRTSRFVIADLTHGNQGAYWEAGFAEGLDRPVIYTCRRAEWDERKTHFDTNHLVTIIWEPDNLEVAGTRLTATIRATMPGEARMSD